MKSKNLFVLGLFIVLTSIFLTIFFDMLPIIPLTIFSVGSGVIFVSISRMLTGKNMEIAEMADKE